MLFSEAQAAEKAVIASRPESASSERHPHQRREPGREEREHRQHDLIRHHLSADLERRDGRRMRKLVELPQHLPRENDRADHLDAAAGRARARDERAQEDEPERREHRPLAVVGRWRSRCWSRPRPC